MSKKYLLALVVCCLGATAYAQTLAQAKQLFNSGKYEEAKPAFLKLVKQSPANANYNYWYGACCYETGEAGEAETYLKKAAGRNVTEAFRYLAEVQAGHYLFDEAVENMEKYIALQQKKKEPTEAAEERLELIKQGGRMLKGTERVTFIDSFVVDKKTFLSAYKLGKESGLIAWTDSYLHTDGEPESTLYQTELGSKIYYARKLKEALALYSQDKLGDKWGEAVPLAGLNPHGNTNYPYVLADGVTLYYASDGEGSLGGYDIFVTRYNSETNQYLRPENIGMPYNSFANDYMYVLDEYNNLGWFASDRYQPEGKVCIYVFIPNETRVTFNYENTEEKQVRRAALIQGISSTWKETAAVRAAKQRLAMVTYKQPKEQLRRDFEFVIDDNTTYYTAGDFKSPKARQAMMQWLQSKKDFATLSRSLEEKRLLYHRSNPGKKQSMTPELMDLERRAEQMEADLAETEVNIRNIEKNYLMK